jgi:hypothetical protein
MRREAGISTPALSPQDQRALQAAEKLGDWGFVTGHDFSRADKANKINGL